MSAKINTPLANALLGSGSLKSLLDAGFLYVFSGTVPATANEAIDGGSVLVGKFTKDDDGSTGLTFAASPANGVLKKTVAEAWEATALATTTMTFFRFCVGSDDGEGVAGGSDYRLQGTIGPDASFDLIRGNPAVTTADGLALNTFQIIQPNAV